MMAPNDSQSSLRIFHLLSNQRWTERAEPAADLACGQKSRGALTVFLCGRGDSPLEDAVFFRAAAKGLPVLQLHLPKHASFWKRRLDVPALRHQIELHRPEVVHTHMANAARTTALALRKIRPRPLWVHSSYEPESPLDSLPRNRSRQNVPDGLVVISEAARNAALDSGIFREQAVRVMEPGIDVARFQQRFPGNPREAFGLAPEDFVVGLVLRARPRRRIDLVLEAVRTLAPRFPRLKLLHIGRGAVADCIETPAADLGIADHVVLGGYCRNDRLVRAYHAMDCLVYLRSGTDPSCRTVKEAMAAGVPPIVSDEGHLPRLVEPERTGLVIPLTQAEVTAALQRCLEESGLRDALARASATRAAETFHRDIQGRHMLDFYRELR